MDNSQFLSDFNITNIYYSINSYINQNANYNLDNNRHYKDKLIPTLAKQVYNKHSNKTTEELNKITIDASKKHVMNLVNKKKRKGNNNYVSSPLANVDTSNMNNTNNDSVINSHNNFKTFDSFSNSKFTYLDVNSSNTNGIFPNESYTNLDSITEFNKQNTLEGIKNVESHRNLKNDTTDTLQKNIIEESEEQINKKKFQNKTNVIDESDTDSEIDSDDEFFKKLDSNLTRNYRSEIKLDNTQNEPKELITYIDDHSDDNLVKSYNPDKNISEISKKQQIDTYTEPLEKIIYTSTNKTNMPKEHNVVILDVYPGDGIEIKNYVCELNENLNITTVCDVYLEFISIHNIGGATKTNNIEFFHTFLLQLIGLATPNTISNNNNIVNKYVIPNETYGINDVGDTGGTDTGASTPATSMVVRLKSNYICTLQPKIVKTIKVTFEGLKHGAKDATIETLKGMDVNGRLQIGLLFKNR